MLKNFFIFLLVLICILVGSGYFIYVNRAVIADKIVSYALNNLGRTSDNTTSSGWADVLVNAGMKSLQTSVQQATAQNTPSSAAIKGNGRLSTMADMFANGTNARPDDLGQMAQVLLQGFSGTMGTSGAEEHENGDIHDINARDQKGRTLLMNVCRVDATLRVVKMLIKYGADVNVKDDNGRTALMYAVALNRNPDVVRYLVEQGADAQATDKQGKTVADFAQDDDVRRVLFGNAY